MLKNPKSKIQNPNKFCHLSFFIRNFPPNGFGFTLIELLLVMAVLGVLAGVVLVNIGPASQQRARDTIRRNDIKQYQTAMEVYSNKNNGNYFVSNGAIVDNCGSGKPLGFLGTCPDNPTVATDGGYGIYSTATLYVLWALLEQPSTTTHFVVCSNGNSGETTDEVPYTSCPL